MLYTRCDDLIFKQTDEDEEEEVINLGALSARYHYKCYHTKEEGPIKNEKREKRKKVK